MSLISISETQLSFGYFRSFMNLNKPRFFAFPSLRQEGGIIPFPFPGADLVINNNHLIQFKRPFYFTTNAIKEFWNYQKPPDFDSPCFRFYIKNDDPTNQFENLIKATQNGLKAEYISPLFSQESDFFQLQWDDTLHLKSYAHIDLNQFNGMQASIGKNNDHTILYNENSVRRKFCYCFSEPKRLEASTTSNRGTSERNYKATELVQLISNIFFNEEKIIFPDNARAIDQCRILQNRLLIEQDIIWTFNF